MQLIFDPRYRRLVDFLSLESEELEAPHVPEKIMFLYDWAEKKTKGGDLNAVLEKLTSLKKDIGSTLRGKSLLVDLYKFTRLDADKILAKEKQLYEHKTEAELKELEAKMLKKTIEKQKAWQDTKDQIYQEADTKDLENIFRANTLARMIKSEDKQQSKTSVNYKIVKDEAPKAVKVKPYDSDPT